MKKIHVLWMLLFLVLSTSCVSVNRLMKVQEGMSRQEISKIFGTPEYRRFDRGMEEWGFPRTSSAAGTLYTLKMGCFPKKVSLLRYRL